MTLNRELTGKLTIQVLNLPIVSPTEVRPIFSIGDSMIENYQIDVNGSQQSPNATQYPSAKFLEGSSPSNTNLITNYDPSDTDANEEVQQSPDVIQHPSANSSERSSLSNTTLIINYDPSDTDANEEAQQSPYATQHPSANSLEGSSLSNTTTLGNYFIKLRSSQPTVTDQTVDYGFIDLSADTSPTRLPFKLMVNFNPYKTATFLFKFKGCFTALLSTVTTALYAPSLFATTTAIFGGAAALEYITTQKYDTTVTILGLLATVVGLGVGTPIIHRCLIGAFAGTAIGLGGQIALTNPIINSMLSFLSSTPGYIATSAVTYGASVAMSTETFKHFASNIIRDNVCPIKQDAAAQIYEQIGGYRYLGLPVGRIIHHYLQPTVNSAIDNAADKAIQGIDILGDYSRTSILKQFHKTGKQYINNLTYLPCELLKYVRNICANVASNQNNVAYQIS